MEWFLISWPTLILFGLGLRMALGLTYGARGPESDDPLAVFLNVTSWVLIALGALPAMVGGVLSIFGLIIVLIAVATVFEGIMQSRMAQRRSMCRIQALLIERGTKMESSVLAAGETMRGMVGRAAKRLFESLQKGTPLLSAAVRNPAALPREAAAYLAAGNSAQLQLAALRELGRSDQGGLDTVWRACIDRILYLVAVLLFMAAALAFVMIKIVPEYNIIFQEFDLELPALTQSLVVMSLLFERYLALPALVVMIATILLVCVVIVFYLFDFRVLAPISDRITFGRRSASLLRIIALATEYREPLNQVLIRVAKLFPSRVIRRRLKPAAKAVEAGADWIDALATADLVSPTEQSLLHTAERVGNLPWVLRQIANRRGKRVIYRLAAALQVLYPLAILAVGGTVAFYCIALFVPIVKLIDGLSR
jgi:type IV pilus assembly protein PilC